jgi:hypothetical protein
MTSPVAIGDHSPCRRVSMSASHSVTHSLLGLALVASCGGRAGLKVGDGSRPLDLAGSVDADSEGAGTVEDAGVDLLSVDGLMESGTPDSRAVDRYLCEPVTCTPQGGYYCGIIGDGCGGTLDCGECPGGLLCNACRPHVCVRSEGVVMSCQWSSGDHYCGKLDDGLGCALDCGECPAGQTCGGGGTPGVCGSEDCATKVTCSTGDTQYCGWIGNGCGGALDCAPECPTGLLCHPDKICHLVDCPSRINCNTADAEYCGLIGDGCGGVVDCGLSCPAGQVCDSDHVCSGSARPAHPAPAPPSPPPMPPPPLRRPIPDPPPAPTTR